VLKAKGNAAEVKTTAAEDEEEVWQYTLH